MRFALTAAALLAASSLAGCGDPSPQVIPGAKHDGFMSALADQKGYVEVGFEDARGPGRRARNEPRAILVYFYGPDGATPMSPPPTDVTIKIGRDSAPVPLEPRSEPGSFASKPADFPQGFRGSLAAKLGGAPIESVVSVR